MEAIFQVYGSITKLSLDDQREIIAGVCAVVTACPPAQVRRVVVRLVLNGTVADNSLVRCSCRRCSSV